VPVGAVARVALSGIAAGATARLRRKRGGSGRVRLLRRGRRRRHRRELRRLAVSLADEDHVAALLATDLDALPAHPVLADHVLREAAVTDEAHRPDNLQE